MEIGVLRIDDRLIHGQVITAWISYADATTVVVADDGAAADEFQQTLLKMATPDTIDLRIVSVKDAAELLLRDEPGRALVLVRGPKQVGELLAGGVSIQNVNVGNMNMKKGKTKVLGNMWVFPEDVVAFEELWKQGVSLEVRAVPNDRSQDVRELLHKLQLSDA